MNTGLKVLMIASDRNMLVPGSAVAQRAKEYAQMVEELHVVLLCDAAHGLAEAQLDTNLWVYPTNSAINIFRPLNAASIGKKIVYEKKFVRGASLITTQDPFECGWAGLKVKEKWRIPLEVQLHTDPNSPYFTGFQNRIRKFVAKKVLRNADNVRTVKDLPIYVEKEKIINAPIAFDLHARYLWKFIMLSVSRLTPEKNLGSAIEVLAGVREKYPDTGLLIVGSGPEEDGLKAKVKKLGQDGFVEFAGWQSDLASFYKTANVFIQTSLFEGYGLSLVEAGLSGLPVVTTSVGLATELSSGQDAYVYPVGRPDLMAVGVIDLIENSHKRENLKLNLRRTLESKLVSKEKYLNKIKENWLKTSQKIG